jgi:hypothetical protein
MHHLKKARVEGIGNVSPKQIKDFSKITFTPEMAVNMLQIQPGRQHDKH